MKLESHQIKLGGAQVNFMSVGKMSTPSVVLLHGASFSAATWQQIGTLESLANANCGAIALDLPGYGNSQPSSISRETWLYEVLEHLEMDRVILLAASMSGGFAFPFMTNYPERIAGFVAVAPVAISTYSDRFHRIKSPVLAIWGERDRTIPLAEAELLVNSVPSGRLIIIPEGSHAPYMSDPTRFNRELVAFVKDCAKG